MTSLRNALETVRQKYDTASETMVQGALDYVVSGTIITGNGCHMFPATSECPVGVSVRNNKCTCLESPLLKGDSEEICVHIIAVAMLTLCNAEEDIKKEVSQDNVLGSHGEAQSMEPHSMTVKSIDNQGFEWLICVRALGVNELFEDARHVKDRLVKYGWRGTGRSLSPIPEKETDALVETRVERPEDTPVVQTKEQVVETKAVPPVEETRKQESEKKDALVFMAESLVATVHEGKSYFKVRGGRFSKFGVTIWPEVLEAAGLKNLDPMKAYDMHGYTAEYVLKEDGKADKVIALRKQKD